MTNQLYSTIALVAILAAPQMALAGNAVDTYPDQYTVENENDRLRIIRVHYEPGEKTGMHSHGPNVAVNLSSGTLLMTLPDGTTQEVAGAFGEANINEAGEHAMENVGDGPVDAVIVEFKE